VALEVGEAIGSTAVGSSVRVAIGVAVVVSVVHVSEVRVGGGIGLHLLTLCARLVARSSVRHLDFWKERRVRYISRWTAGKRIREVGGQWVRQER
jgi:hypothetical protein